MAKRPLSTNKQLSALVKGLEKKFGYANVNYRESADCNVGFWSVPADESSAAKLNDDSSKDEIAYVRLCNSPIFKGFTWGSLIRVKTRGETRAYFSLAMQRTDKAVKADQAYLKKFIAEKDGKVKAPVRG